MNSPHVTQLIPIERVEKLIHLARGEKVLLDADLAKLYGVETKALNQAVRRNLGRFPADFMFQLTREESDTLFASRSQSVTLNKRGTNIKYLPYAFTEQGVAMLSSVLRSERAVHSLSASTGERVRVRCRFGFPHPATHDAAGETAPRNRLPRHSRGRCRSGQSQSQTQMKPVTLHQQSTLNHQLAANGQWLERFEEWLEDSGFLKRH